MRFTTSLLAGFLLTGILATAPDTSFARGGGGGGGHGVAEAAAAATLLAVVTLLER